eukprot:2078654-Amphidinium_carterae.1
MCGLTRTVVPGDGNCLFYALELVLTRAGLQIDFAGRSRSLREVILDALHNPSDALAAGWTFPTTMAAEATRLATLGSWGGEEVIWLVSVVWHVHVLVVSPTVSLDYGAGADRHATVALAYNGSSHYDAALPEMHNAYLDKELAVVVDSLNWRVALEENYASLFSMVDAVFGKPP